MKIYREIITDTYPENQFVCDTPLALTMIDRQLGDFNFAESTYCQPCRNLDLHRALGLSPDMLNLCTFYIDLSKEKPTVWMATVSCEEGAEEVLPGDYYMVEPTDVELFDLLKQAIFFLASQVIEIQQRAELDESLAAAVAGVSVEDHRDQLLAMAYQMQAASGYRIQ